MVHLLGAGAAAQLQQQLGLYTEFEEAPIAQTCDEQDCVLIVVGKHGHNVIKDLLLGSVTSHVLTESVSDLRASTSTNRV